MCSLRIIKGPDVGRKGLKKSRDYVLLYIVFHAWNKCKINLSRVLFVCRVCLCRRSAAARLLRLWVRNPPGAWMPVGCECCVLWGRGLCDELITRPEESYRLCCVVVCDLETSRMGAPYIYDISRLRVKVPGSLFLLHTSYRFSFVTFLNCGRFYCHFVHFRNRVFLHHVLFICQGMGFCFWQHDA